MNTVKYVPESDKTLPELSFTFEKHYADNSQALNNLRNFLSAERPKLN